MIGIAKRNGFDVRLPAWPLTEYLELPEEMFGHEISGRLPVWNLNRHRDGRFAYEDLNLAQSTDFRGLFQSERWWAGADDEIRSGFRLKAPFEDQLRQRWGSVLSERPVSLHVRRTDYLAPQNAHFLDPVKLGFYECAVELVAKDVPILVFSDDPDWCREHLFEEREELRKRLVFVDDSWRDPASGLSNPILRTRKRDISTGYDLLEMFLMSYCAEHVVPNSTYSWWGAWLNPSPEKTVVFHEGGFSEEWLRREGDLSARTPAGWLKLQPEPCQPG